MERSSGWRVRVQSSTETTSETACGKARSRSEARASAEAPAWQPRPKMGVRFTEGFRASRFMSLASSDGVERPVTVTNQRWSTSPGVRPARPRASRTAASPTSWATRIQASFRFPKVSSEA
jgi:hypothetical protein